MEAILPDSDEAAKLATVEGWVSRNGRFFGSDERMARWDGATHLKCSRCDVIIKKGGWTICPECKEKKDGENYNNMKKEVWDEETPLYSASTDEYFFNYDEVYYRLEDNDLQFDEMRFLICVPMHLRTVDDSYFYDDLPEDGDIPDSVRAALDNLNSVIEKEGPVGWIPGDTRAIRNV